MFEIGVEVRLWSSFWCRSSPFEHAVHPLTPRPLYFLDSFEFPHLIPFVNKLNEVVTESQSIPFVNNFRKESSGLHAVGSWSQATLMVNGILQPGACAQWTKTCSLISEISALRVPNGQVKFSLLQPGTIIRPHAGPTNKRLRMHCSVSLPPELTAARMRVGTEWRSWYRGGKLSGAPPA